MSLIRPVLNRWLRLTEKPLIARATPHRLRRSLETKSRIFFWPPRGTSFTETPLAGRPTTWVNAPEGKRGRDPLILYFHGGGYVFGSPRTHRAMLAQLSRRTGLPACLPDYRKAPEHPFPAAIEDTIDCYVAAIQPGRPVVIGGDSAGGGLVLALLHEILRRGLPHPLGTFAFSPLTDMTFSGASFRGNEQADVELPATRAGEMSQMYLRGADPSNPLASPLFGDFTDAPPVWLVAGDTEILLDDTRRMAKRLVARGVNVTCKIEHDLPHVWPILHNLLPEARATLDQLAIWIRSLSPPPDES